MGLDARKPNFVACKQQRCRPACTVARSDHCLCYSLSGKEGSQIGCMQNFNILTTVDSVD